MNPLKQIAPQVDPITGMAVQPGQIQPNPMINSRALGGAQENVIPGMFPGSAFQQKKQTQTKSSLTAGLLNARDSKEAAKATKAITDAQKKALEKKKLKETMKKAAAETATEVSQDVVSGERKKQ